MNTAEATVAHHQNLVAWLRGLDDTADQSLEIILDACATTHWRQRFTGIPAEIGGVAEGGIGFPQTCLLYTSPSPRDATLSRMPSSA